MCQTCRLLNFSLKFQNIITISQTKKISQQSRWQCFSDVLIIGLKWAIESSSALMLLFKDMSGKKRQSGRPGWVQDQRPGYCLGVQVGAVGHEGWGKGRGRVMASPCPSGCAMGPLGDLGQEASLQPPYITVPFKATQHLFPPIKTNNLFCRKSRQLLSARAEAWLDGL